MPACVNIMIQLNTGIPPSSSPHVIHVIVVPWVVMVYGIHVRTSESVYVFPRVKPEELHYTLGCSVAGSNYMYDWISRWRLHSVGPTSAGYLLWVKISFTHQ